MQPWVTAIDSCPSLKATNLTRRLVMLLPFRERKLLSINLGFRSFHSLHPRLYTFVAFGDQKRGPGWKR